MHLDHELVARGLLRLTNWWSRSDTYDCGCAFATGPVFVESYGVRAALRVERLLHLGLGRRVAHAFCDRVVAWQGLAETDMYCMGYGLERNADGVPSCSCVADAASSALALCDTVAAYPDSPRKAAYVASLRRYADYVLKEYANADGVIGVGILGFQKNPMPTYWCANGLFGAVLADLADLTQDARYIAAAAAPLEFIARYDYANTDWREWRVSPVMMVLYSTEGLLCGLEAEALKARLAQAPAGFPCPASVTAAAAPAPVDQAPNRQTAKAASRRRRPQGPTLRDLLEGRLREWLHWLGETQTADGLWPLHANREYRDYEAGLGWMLVRTARLLGDDERTTAMLTRHLAFLESPAAKEVFGLYCHPFATGLAHLSFAAAAEECLRADPVGFRACLAALQRDRAALLW